MFHLSQLTSSFPLAVEFTYVLNWIIYVVGIIGCILILLSLLLCLMMIPDFVRYMKIKSM